MLFFIMCENSWVFVEAPAVGGGQASTLFPNGWSAPDADVQ